MPYDMNRKGTLILTIYEEISLMNGFGSLIMEVLAVVISFTWPLHFL